MENLVLCTTIYKRRCNGRPRARRTSLRRQRAAEEKLKKSRAAITGQNTFVLSLPAPYSGQFCPNLCNPGFAAFFAKF